MCDGNFVSRDEVALVPTPGGQQVGSLFPTWRSLKP